jgi:class 3 adenylate cyclase/tetratricopeptide (TPR) repeat protein
MAGSTCSACGTQNPERARFCMSCGAALQRACPSCGAEVPPGARFCVECGTALDAPAEPAAPTPGRAPSPAEGAVLGPEAPPEERRLVSVLFADLSGYTAYAERKDPEAVKSMLDRTLRQLGEEVLRFGGTIDKYIGDNVMAVFGAPVSHEDDPERAVRAALSMQEAMGTINADLPGDISFLLRVGINTGEVLAGSVGDGYTVIGDVVNVASRLQAAARPGTVTVGEATFRATRDSVAYEPLAPLDLKGKAEPVPAWEAREVMDALPAHRPASRTASPLVGREEEAGLMIALAQRVAREERPHLVTVIGQAGVGKSRLLRELSVKAAGLEPAPNLRIGECPPYGSGIAYWAMAEVIRSEFGISADEASESAWEKLLEGTRALLDGKTEGDSSERTAAVIGVMLGLEAGEAGTAVDAEDPQRMRETLFSAVRTLVEAMTAEKPLVLAFEDIHWADEGMLDLIEHLARWVRGPLLITCLARDELLERRADWGAGRRNSTTVGLDPLTRTETLELVEVLYGGENGDSGLLARVAQRAGGNPLFAEEIVNRLKEEGSDADALPDTVHSVLAARLDSLAPFERRLLQYASVVGQTFWEGVLLSAARESPADVGEALDSLQEKELVIASESTRLAGEREYAFKHALIRDVAYGMLPKATRCRQHFAVGRFIEERAGESGEIAVALVAEHYGRAAGLGTEAGIEPAELRTMSDKALHFLEAAGDAAAQLYSNQEALSHYRGAIGLDGTVDEATRAQIGEKMGDVALRVGRVDEAIEVWESCLDFHRRQEDLARVGDLHRKIGAAYWDKGEREASIDHYQKGIDLLKDGPPCIELVRLYEEAASLYMHTGDNMLAIYASEKALRLAERLGEAAAASRAHGIFGRVFGRIGDSEKARENLERSVELARGSDQAEAVRALLTLGYHFEISEADYAGAGAAYEEALKLAVEVGDVPSQVEVHAALAQLALNRADWEAVERETEASAGLAEREGLLGKLCFPYVMRGALRWRSGDWEGAESLCRRAHEIGEQVGRSEVAFQALYWLSVTLRDQGKYSDAEMILARALDICERAGLVAQSVEAISKRAVCLALGGHAEQAREAAESAANLADRLHYPVGAAAAAEAGGITLADPEEGTGVLAEASAAWEGLGLPLDAAGCELLRAHRLAEMGSPDAPAVAAAAAERYESLGVSHLAQRARELVPG